MKKQKGSPRPDYPQLRDKTWWEQNKHRTTTEITEELGCTYATAHRWRHRLKIEPAKATGPRVGESGEQFVLERLAEFGIEAKYFPRRHPFDIEVAGKRIDVKTSSSRRPNSAHPSPRYSFMIKTDGLNEVDFYVLVATHPDDWACFVVPVEELIGRTAISFAWPAHNPSENPWIRYLERWDLLDIL